MKSKGQCPSSISRTYLELRSTSDKAIDSTWLNIMEVGRPPAEIGMTLSSFVVSFSSFAFCTNLGEEGFSFIPGALSEPCLESWTIWDLWTTSEPVEAFCGLGDLVETLAELKMQLAVEVQWLWFQICHFSHFFGFRHRIPSSPLSSWVPCQYLPAPDCHYEWRREYNRENKNNSECPWKPRKPGSWCPSTSSSVSSAGLVVKNSLRLISSLFVWVFPDKMVKMMINDGNWSSK